MVAIIIPIIILFLYSPFSSFQFGTGCINTRYGYPGTYQLPYLGINTQLVLYLEQVYLVDDGKNSSYAVAACIASLLGCKHYYETCKGKEKLNGMVYLASRDFLLNRPVPNISAYFAYTKAFAACGFRFDGAYGNNRMHLPSAHMFLQNTKRYAGRYQLCCSQLINARRYAKNIPIVQSRQTRKNASIIIFQMQ